MTRQTVVLGLILMGGSSAMSEVRQGPDWVLANPQADWQARDSQGEFVYDGHMWILAGGSRSRSPTRAMCGGPPTA